MRYLFAILCFLALSTFSSCSNPQADEAAVNEGQPKLNASQKTVDADGLVQFYGLAFSLSEGWSSQVKSDTAMGYVYKPCSDTYCNNLYISQLDLGADYDYRDWSGFLSAYVAELKASNMLDVQILKHNYGEQQDSSRYQLRYSYQNGRGHVLISELHFIWPKPSILYILDFTAKDEPRSAFADFKINGIQPFISSLRY